MSTRVSYMNVYSVFLSQDKYSEIIVATISKLNGQLSLAWVKSCITIGPGNGERELQFINQCARNTSKFVAIEPDHESAEGLRTRLVKNLPGVDSQVFETRIQSWKGLDD